MPKLLETCVKFCKNLCIITHPQVLVLGAQTAEEAGGEPSLGGDVPPAPGGVHQVASHEPGPGDLLSHVVSALK